MGVLRDIDIYVCDVCGSRAEVNDDGYHGSRKEVRSWWKLSKIYSRQNAIHLCSTDCLVKYATTKDA